MRTYPGRSFFTPLGLIVLVLFPPGAIFADSPATPCSYTVASDAGLFVMLAPDVKSECLSQGEEPKRTAKALREKYGASGLYSGPDPVWTVDWFSYKVYLSKNGKYLVRMGPWASSGSNEAFSFFADGKLLKTYKVEDIVRDVAGLPHSVSHFEWKKNTGLDDAAGTFRASTLEGGDFIFDLATGEIREGRKPFLPSAEALTEPRFYIDKLPWIGVTIVSIAVFLLAVFLIRRRKRRS